MTDEEKQQLIALKLGGLTYREIGKMYGVSRQRIHQLMSPSKTNKSLVKWLADNKCSVCGTVISGKAEIHHKKQRGNSGGYNNISHLQLLCVACHRKIHAKIKDCPTCGKGFSGINKYCSQDCRHKAHTMSLVCSECGIVFDGRKGQIKKRISQNQCGLFFCSKSCYGKHFARKSGFQKGHKNPWRLGKSKYRKLVPQIKQMVDEGNPLSRVLAILGIPQGNFPNIKNMISKIGI